MSLLLPKTKLYKIKKKFQPGLVPSNIQTELKDFQTSYRHFLKLISSLLPTLDHFLTQRSNENEGN